MDDTGLPSTGETPGSCVEIIHTRFNQHEILLAESVWHHYIGAVRMWPNGWPPATSPIGKEEGDESMRPKWNEVWRVPCLVGLVALAYVGTLAGGCAAATESTRSGATGGSATSITLGVVNPQVVLERSNAGRAAIDQLKQFVDEKRKVLATEEADIRALDQKLKDQDKTFTEAQRQERQRHLAGRVQQYQQKTQQLNQDIAAKQKTLTSESMQKIQAAIQTVAKAAGVTVVLHEGTESNLLVVLYHEPRVDLTERVLQELNRQNP